MNRWFFLCIFLALSFSTYAKDSSDSREKYYSDYYEKCQGKIDQLSASNLFVTDECTASELEFQDKNLNLQYEKLMRDEKEGDDRQAFRNAQRLWIKFRDSNCQAMAKSADADGGTIEIMAFNNCLLAMIIDRRIELEKMMPVESQ